MNQVKQIFSLVFALLLAVPCAMAQEVDFEKDFEDFQKEQKKEFNNFKSQADADFDTFLREAWTKFEAFEPIPAPERPEPVEPTVFNPKAPAAPPVQIKPAAPKVPAMVDKPAPGVYVPGRPYVPVKVDIPVVPPRTVRRTPIEFYGTAFEVATDAIGDFALSGNREPDVADGWSTLCKADHEQLIKDCMVLRTEKRLNDWAYVLFTKQIGVQLYGAERTDDVAFLQMFILNKSGYKVRLSKIDEKLKLMISPAGALYGTPYIMLEGAKYYVFDAGKQNGAMGVYTYRQDFANARNLVCLDVTAVPQFQADEYAQTLSAKSGSLRVQTTVNKNLMAFYKDYPQCDVAVYYKTPMSAELKASLYPALKAAIQGKSKKDAANLLIEFVQTGFEYKTDGEQFGYEKPFFLDENFFYPACDCEDRSILYATLVKDLLGLDAILLDYPNHIATAVRFDETLPGDYIVLDEGGKYLICDPTYIGASIGRCMDAFKDVSPQIIR